LKTLRIDIHGNIAAVNPGIPGADLKQKAGACHDD